MLKALTVRCWFARWTVVAAKDNVFMTYANR